MKTDIKKDYIWNTIGVFAQTAISPLLLIAVTRLNGIHDSGLVSFAFAIALIFWSIASWGGRTYQVSDSKKDFLNQSYIITRLLLGVAILLGSLVFCVINNYETLKSAIIVSFVAFKVIESVADAIYGVLQVNGRLYITGKSLLTKAILGFASFLLIDALTQSVFLGSLGFVIMNLLVLFLYDIPNAKKVDDISMSIIKISHYISEASVIIKRCAPIAVVAILAMFSLNIPRYFLDIYHADQVGYFGILAMPITALGLFITFILQPNIVALSKLFHEKSYEKFNGITFRLMKITTLFGIALIVIVYLAGVNILELVFGVDFSIHKTTLMILAVGALFNAYVFIFMNILTITRHLKEQFYVLIISNLILLLLSVSVVNKYALMGSMLLFTVINATQFISLYVSYKNVLNHARKKGV